MPKIKSPDLQVNNKFEGDATDMTFIVEIDPTKRLRAGSYLFQLQVTDDAGNVSAPDNFTLRIVDRTVPTAVITGPDSVAVGQGFTLSGERSSDPEGGRLAKYVWILMRAP